MLVITKRMSELTREGHINMWRIKEIQWAIQHSEIYVKSSDCISLLTRCSNKVTPQATSVNSYLRDLLAYNFATPLVRKNDWSVYYTFPVTGHVYTPVRTVLRDSLPCQNCTAGQPTLPALYCGTAYLPDLYCGTAYPARTVLRDSLPTQTNEEPTESSPHKVIFRVHVCMHIISMSIAICRCVSSCFYLNCLLIVEWTACDVRF